jgi:predicted DNA-binding transcriptional regulator YafY
MEKETDKLRYSRMTDLLQLLYMMMAEPLGVSLDDICDEFSVSRRTAERMRDAITSMFSQVDVINETGKVKRWGFINYSMPEIVRFTDEEILTMEIIKHNIHNSVYKEIDSIIDKMKALREKKKK